MHESDKEFDLKLRSLLDGVEEEVPQRVWEGVSSRIGRRSAPVAWMRWAGASLAAAAAVALAVVLSGTFKGGSDSIAVPQDSLVAEVQAPAAEQTEDISETEVTLPQTMSAATTRRTSGRMKAEPAAASQELSTEKPEAVSAEEPSVAPEQKQETAAPEKSLEKKNTKTQAWDDPFARMAYEDAHARQPHKTSIAVGGLVGTNDGAKPGSRGSGMMGTSGERRGTGIIENGESRYGVPASLGLGVRVNLCDKWSVGTGVNFSQLTRSFDGAYYNESNLEAITGKVRNNVQYVGIPVNLFYNVVSNKVLDFYTFAGGSVEKCISNRFRMPQNGEDIIYNGQKEGLQYSAALGLGVQFNLTDHFGLYIDPSARYWMGKDQPKSIRTQQPFMFNIELGLRFEL